MFEGKKLFFTFDKGEILDFIIDLFPERLSVYSEFEDSSVFETNQQFVVILFICVFLEFLYLAQGKVNELVA